MKASRLREQTDEELRQLCGDTRRELLDIRLKQGGSEATVQPLRMRTLRRDLARMETVLRERERASDGR